MSRDPSDTRTTVLAPAETAQQTRDQILQQFQVAIRGQANASAGAALQLLNS